MFQYERKIEKNLLESIQSNKAVILFGARRTGKTILIKNLVKKLNENYLFLNGEDITTSELLERRSVGSYQQLLGDTKILIIDEAQKIPDISLKVKLMLDEIDGLKIILTGSSALDLGNQFGEPLVGRKYDFQLYPLSELEFSQNESNIAKLENMRSRLIFGNYPELTKLKNRKEKIQYLNELKNGYLLKDILTIDGLKNSNKISNLLRLISYQIGSEVNYSELGTQLSLSKNTVEKYMELLSKVFVLYKLEGFSKNLRKEVSKSSKWYFHDNGIRNSLINNFNPIDQRDDVGKLWENYMISERIKFNQLQENYAELYFWRTYDNQEIDLIEQVGNNLNGFEFKWTGKNSKPPAAWAKAYPSAGYSVIDKSNFFQFLGL